MKTEICEVLNLKIIYIKCEYFCHCVLVGYVEYPDKSYSGLSINGVAL